MWRVEESYGIFMIDKQQIEKWFDGFWVRYPLTLCQNKRGGRPNALRAALKLKPDEKEQKRIDANTKAKIAYDTKAKRAGEFVERWPHVSTYLNQGRYDDGIPSTVDLKHKIKLRQCTQCSNNTHGENYSVCTDHLPNTSHITESMKKESLKKCGYWKKPDETVEEWQTRCAMYVRKRFGRFAAATQKDLSKL